MANSLQALKDALRSHRPGYLPQLQCADGLKMSVQASRYHYCTPREDVADWTSVEVGFPSKRIKQFMPYIDGGAEENPTDTVYGYVPIEVVAAVIDEHGGLVTVEAF